MNQKGEVTLFSVLVILALTNIVLLSSLELRRSFKLLERRTHLFLCLKETKGELHDFMKFMGRSNWAIKNINRASLVMLFIPGLQGAAMDAQKAKKYLQYVQEGKVISYLNTLKNLKQKGCPLDPRMFITPFQIGTRLLVRDESGGARLREKKWTYIYISKPYFLSLNVHPSTWESVKPNIQYMAEEKGARLSSLLSSHF